MLLLLLLLVVLLPALLFAAWHLLPPHTTPPPKALRNKRIILLIAHPDDEAMFFAPTLQALTNPALGNHLKILCLSTGDADGLGSTRSKELVESALLLGVRKREDVFVMDDPRFRDGMSNVWRTGDVCRVLGMAFAPQIVNTGVSGDSTPSTTATTTQSEEKDSFTTLKKDKRKSKNIPPTPKSNPTPPPPPTPTPRATIDVLITFDASGISSHPNHIALHSGAHAFLSAIMAGCAADSTCPVALYTLPTVPLWRKYTFILDALTTLLASLMFAPSSNNREDDSQVLFVNSMQRYWDARNAMVRAHVSQMVWFRWGWISMGRYMVVNDLKREEVNIGTDSGRER